METLKSGYLISEVAKEVEVENHVLRYWEEELNLPVKRTTQGHRYYTKEDITRFIHVKELKSKGLQLKAIKSILKEEEQKGDMVREREQRGNSELLLINTLGTGRKDIKVSKSTHDADLNKVHRLQILLQAMIAEAVSDNNKVLCESIQEIVQKEMDYQFRQQEEIEEQREEIRIQREDEHYKQLDELLRERSAEKTGKTRRNFLWLKQ